MFPLIENIRGTTLFVAFVLNSIAAAFISTMIVEIRLSQSRNGPVGVYNNKMLTTFVIGLISTFLVYNFMYLLIGFGSSMCATKQVVPYW